MQNVTDVHVEEETLSIKVNLPGHGPRKETSLYTRTHKLRVDVDTTCWICGRIAKDTGHPLETHHHPVERSLAEMTDFRLVQADCEAGMYGDAAKSFDWADFWVGAVEVHDTITYADGVTEEFIFLKPVDPYKFVDNMLVNGRVLCKEHHIGKDEGIHYLPYPLHVGQRYARKGYKFSNVEIIHHGHEGAAA